LFDFIIAKTHCEGTIIFKVAEHATIEKQELEFEIEQLKSQVIILDYFRLGIFIS